MKGQFHNFCMASMTVRLILIMAVTMFSSVIPNLIIEVETTSCLIRKLRVTQRTRKQALSTRHDANAIHVDLGKMQNLSTQGRPS